MAIDKYLPGDDPDLHWAAITVFDLSDDQLLPDYSSRDCRSGAHGWLFHLGVFWRILLPLSAPALVTLVVVNALWVWNELLIALVFMQKDELKTLMVGISALRSRNYVDIPATMAGLTIATIPIVVVYMLGQRYFIRGMVSGAVK